VPSLEAAHVGVDHLVVAGHREQQRHVDVDASRGELLNRGNALLGRGDLDHDVRPLQPTPQVERLLDRRVTVAGEVGGALERDEPVASIGLLVGGAKQVGGAAYVVECELEEELPWMADPRGDSSAQLVVVAVRAGDGLGEDRGIRGSTGHLAIAHQPSEVPAVEQIARERVEPDRYSGVMERT
jgi:hypothetical protein